MNLSATVEAYVASLLDFNIPETEVPDDLAWRIWKILTNEHRLARRPDADFKARILVKIKNSIDVQEPIVLINATGGFKNFASPTSPHADWSEVFAIHYLSKQCAAIGAIYEPGVQLEFSGDSYILPLFDNYLPEDIDTYIRDFGHILAVFQKHLPANVKLSQKNMDEFYDVPALEKRLLAAADGVDLNGPQANAWYEQFKDKAVNNINPDGVENFRAKTAVEMEPIIRRSVILDRLWIKTDLEERLDYLEGGNRLPLIQTAIPDCIALKSVPTSKLAFWLGVGYLSLENNRLLPRIEHATKWSALTNITEVAVDSKFKTIAKLATIPITLNESGF